VRSVYVLSETCTEKGLSERKGVESERRDEERFTALAGWIADSNDGAKGRKGRGGWMEKAHAMEGKSLCLVWGGTGLAVKSYSTT